MLEPLGPIEPMETILEVSEMSSRATSADHSRTTSADSHKTETKTNFKDHFCQDNLNDSVQLSTIESANDLILSSTQIKRPPYFFQKPANREISDGEKNFTWETVSNPNHVQILPKFYPIFSSFAKRFELKYLNSMKKQKNGNYSRMMILNFKL